MIIYMVDIFYSFVIIITGQENEKQDIIGYIFRV